MKSTKIWQSIVLEVFSSYLSQILTFYLQEHVISNLKITAHKDGQDAADCSDKNKDKKIKI